MGKRSNFERNERDWYKTPVEAVRPLIPFLPKGDFTFAEASAGDGALISAVQKLSDYRGRCVFASDIEPQAPWIKTKDAFTVTGEDIAAADMVIMNPPWKRAILHPMITHFSDLKNTWLLFDANWLWTKQAKPYLDRLYQVVTIGRVKWIPDSKMTGKDDCCWFNFRKDARDLSVAPLIYGKDCLPFSPERKENGNRILESFEYS